MRYKISQYGNKYFDELKENDDGSIVMEYFNVVDYWEDKKQHKYIQKPLDVDTELKSCGILAYQQIIEEGDPQPIEDDRQKTLKNEVQNATM